MSYYYYIFNYNQVLTIFVTFEKDKDLGDPQLIFPAENGLCCCDSKQYNRRGEFLSTKQSSKAKYCYFLKHSQPGHPFQYWALPKIKNCTTMLKIPPS